MAGAERSAPIAARSARPVMFLHGSLASGRMWRAYAADLDAAVASLAPDLTGYGETPAWPDGAPFRLCDEFAGIDAALGGAAGAVDVVAHSYGAAVALAYALARPQKVASLFLVEPTLFAVLRDLGATARWYLAEIAWVARMVEEHVALGQPRAAMHGFVDYWNGKGSWAALPEDRRALFAGKAACVARNFEAGFRSAPSLADLGRLDVPTRIVTGSNSPRAAIAASRAVLGVLPKADCLSIPGAGHMLPVTHADLCRRLVRDWRRDGLAAACERAA